MNIFTFDDFFPDSVTHGFFGRRGGVSTGLYDSLNCSLQSQDLPEALAENRDRVLCASGGTGLSTLKQIHSPICHAVEGTCLRGIEEGDALVTKTPGQVLGCLTADCGPVLFYGEDAGGRPVIGAAHAGWGGALKGVLESTIEAMVNLGAGSDTLRAALGPCLAQESYEVGAEFMNSFTAEDERASCFFTPTFILPRQGGGEGAGIPSPLTGEGQDGGVLTAQKLLFNLPAYIAFRLKRAGVSKVALAGVDTYANEADYFSYRRATHRNEPDYGRQMSAICIGKS